MNKQRMPVLQTIIVFTIRVYPIHNWKRFHKPGKWPV